MKCIYSLLVCLITCLTINAQTTVTINAERDNTIYSESNETSNGAGSNLFVGRTGTNGGNLLRRSLVYFNLSTIPAGSVITSVSVSLYCNQVSSTGTNSGITLRKLLNDWGEGTSSGSGSNGGAATTNDATWSYRIYNTLTWNTAGGDFSGTNSGSATVNQTGAISISTNTLVADVQGFVDNAATNFGWAIINTNESDANSARRLVSHESFNDAQRPKITITYTGSLPVTLKSFTAVLQQQSALLEWRAHTEINNSHFNVEHSTNGQDFKVIGKVNGAGNSTIERSYRFTHTNAAPGTNYYRLAQHDFNGEVKYSFIVVVNRADGLQLRVGQNPVSSQLYLRNAGMLRGEPYIIRSSIGQVISKGTISEEAINVQMLPGGLYFISVQASSKQTQTKSFIKD